MVFLYNNGSQGNCNNPAPIRHHMKCINGTNAIMAPGEVDPNGFFLTSANAWIQWL